MTPTDPVDQQQSNKQRTILLATDSRQSALAEVVGDDINRLAYAVYGHQSAQQKVATRLGFNGELREAQTCWYLLGNGYRAYNPRLMRFHSPDSWSPFGRGGLNPYMYCVGDPVNRSDPTGHWPSFKAVGSFLKTLGPGKSRPVALNKLDLSGAMEMIGQAHNARINYVAPPTRSSGIGDILYTLGTAHRMPGDSPRVTRVTETARHFPGYVQGAALDGLSSRPSRSTPQAQSSSGGSRYGHDAPPAYDPPPSYAQATQLWNADTFAASQQPRTYMTYPTESGKPTAYVNSVQSGRRSSTSTTSPSASSSAPVGSSTHSSTVRPTLSVASIRRPDPPPPARRRLSSHGSFNNSGNSDWSDG